MSSRDTNNLQNAQKSIAYCIYISKYNHRCHHPSTARIIKDQEEKRT